MSNFAFLQSEFGDLFPNARCPAGGVIGADRSTGKLLLCPLDSGAGGPNWLFDHDRTAPALPADARRPAPRAHLPARKKATQFIRANEDHIAIRKLKHNKLLTASDLAELERFLFESGGVQGRKQFKEAFGNHDSLSVFIRSLVGLGRNAAKQAFAKYLDAAPFNTSQIRFVELIIDHLTQRGVMDAGVLYEQPFTGIHYEGLDGVFPSAMADEIVTIIELINANAKISVAA